MPSTPSRRHRLTVEDEDAPQRSPRGRGIDAAETAQEAASCMARVPVPRPWWLGGVVVPSLQPWPCVRRAALALRVHAMLLLFMPTRCGYKVRDLDRGCLLRVNGLARGCYKYHSQVKRDAIYE